MNKIRPVSATQIPLDSIFIDPTNHRPDLDRSIKKDNDLIESIKAHGIVHPIIVVLKPDGALYILSGHRRYLVARALYMETAPCVLLEYHEDITVNVARQISANKFGERPGAWQRMRTLGELIRAKSMGEESTRKEAIRKFANATGMNPGTLASIVSAYNCLNYKARDLLEDNLREASWIPERTLLKIAHKKPEKHFDQIAKALGFNENGEIDPSTQTRKTRGAARRPRRFHHEIQTLLGVRGPVRVTVVPSRTKTVVEIATKGKKPLNTSGEWTLDMVRMLRQSIDVALEKLTSTLQPHKDETTTERDGTVVAIVPTRDYHEMTCDHNIPPLKPLE